MWCKHKQRGSLEHCPCKQRLTNLGDIGRDVGGSGFLQKFDHQSISSSTRYIGNYPSSDANSTMSPTEPSPALIDPTPPPNKRRKTQLACHPCRTRKTGCDGHRPHCSSCVMRGWQDRCGYQEKETYPLTSTPAPYVLLNEIIVVVKLICYV